MTAPNAQNLVTGGEDTVWISFYCTWKKDNQLDEMESAKLAAQSHIYKRDEDVPANFTVGEYKYHVAPDGFTPGNDAGSRCNFTYKLQDSGITIGVNARECDSDSKMPNVRVEIGSLPLILAGGLPAMWPGIKARVEALGARIHKNRIGRADSCVDLADCHVGELQKAFVQKQWVSRAKAMALFDEIDVGTADEVYASDYNEPITSKAYVSGTRETGFVVGRSRIQCKAYDKLLETRKSEEKRLALVATRWGKMPAMAMRVEFKLDREALRGFTIIGKTEGIKTVEDWLEHRAAILKYLCTSWFRIMAKEFDRSHTDRLKYSDLHPLWQRVIEAFTAWAKVSNDKVERVPPSIKLQSEDLWNQAAGCTVTAMQRAAVEIEIEKPGWQDRFIEKMVLAMKQTLSRVDFFRKWESKRDQLEVSIPPSILHPFGQSPSLTATRFPVPLKI